MSELRDVIQSTHSSFLVNKRNSNLKKGKTLADGQAKPPVQAQTQMAEAPWSSSLRRSKQVNRGPLKTQKECQNQILMKMEGANSAHLSTADVLTDTRRHVAHNSNEYAERAVHAMQNLYANRGSSK